MSCLPVNAVQYRIILPLFALLAGCQSSPHRFDGHTGYEVSPLNESAFLMVYTEEATTSWSKLESSAARHCQQLLAEKKQTATTKVLRRDVYEQLIAKPIPQEHLVMGPLVSKNQNPNPGVRVDGSIPQHRIYVKMKKAMIICEPPQAASSATADSPS